MQLVRGSSTRERRLDLLAAHMAGLDRDRPRARDRLEKELGDGLATLLVAALSRRSAPVPLGRAQLVAVAA